MKKVSKDPTAGKLTPLDFPVEILDKLHLHKIFRESAEYYLECWDKLNLYKEEKLIKPLYEESRVYVEEIRNILYALTFNKQLDLHAREVFYNYLCFDKDHAQTIKSYFRNLSDKYISKEGLTRQAEEPFLHRSQGI